MQQEKAIMEFTPPTRQQQPAEQQANGWTRHLVILKTRFATEVVWNVLQTSSNQKAVFCLMERKIHSSVSLLTNRFLLVFINTA